MATVVGLFDNRTQAETAVHQLHSSGINPNDISIALQNPDAGKAEVTTATTATTATTTTTQGQDGDTGSHTMSGVVSGGVLGGMAGVVVGLLGLTVPGLGPILVAGPLGAALTTGLVGAGIGAAAGGLVGALTNAGVPEEEATMYQTAVQRGGVLVTAKVPDGQEASVQNILNSNGARNVREDATLLNDPNYRYGKTNTVVTNASHHGTSGVGSEAVGGGAGAVAGAVIGTAVAGPLGTGLGAAIGGAAGAMTAGAAKGDNAGETVGSTGGGAAGAVTGGALGAIGGPVGMAAGAAIGAAVGGAAGKGTSDVAEDAVDDTNDPARTYTDNPSGAGETNTPNRPA